MRGMICITSLLVFYGCTSEPEPPAQTHETKIAVLLVNHGSRSDTWREMLLDLEQRVEAAILEDARIHDVRTAFMEYTEPSIATRLAEFDREGYDEVIIVPVFITVSSHSLDDIPTIVGIKRDPKVIASLAKEKIDIYRPRSRVTLTPTLDVSRFLKQNIHRRLMEKLEQQNLDQAGLVMVAYGDAAYNQQWEELLQGIGRYAQLKGQAGAAAFAWCGHLVHYAKQPTVDAIHQLLEVEQHVVVVPVLVAWDEDFQEKIIGAAVAEFEHGGRVHYTDDAILPDRVLDTWIVQSVRDALQPVI